MRLFKKTKIDEIVKFSETILNVLVNSNIELHDKLLKEEEILIGDYRVVYVNRNLNGIWYEIAEVVPERLTIDHGYSDEDSMEYGEDGWYYRKGGLFTQCLPPKEVRDEVLKLLSKNNIVSSTHTGTVVYQKNDSDCVCCEGDEHVFSKHVDFGSEDNVKDLLHNFLIEHESFAEGKKLKVTFQLK